MIKKDSRGKNFNFYDSMYFDLLDAMKKDTCPICFLVQKSEYRYMATLFYELVNDPGVRDKLRDSYGFCPRHARLAKRVGKPLGIAIIYEDICATLIERIKEGGKITNPGKGCPVCRFAKEVEEHYLKTFLENFSNNDFQNKYKKGFGLCMHHFVTAYLRLPGQREKEKLKNYQLHMLNEHLSRLREFIRKHDYRFSNEGFGKEANSWNRIVDKIIGEGD